MNKNEKKELDILGIVNNYEDEDVEEENDNELGSSDNRDAFSPDLKHKIKIPVLASLAWDIEHQLQTLRIMTLNMQGLPLDLINGVGNSLIQCDPESHCANSQEHRFRALFQWIEKCPEYNIPHIFCLQEVLWAPLIEYTDKSFQKYGYHTHANISLLTDQGCNVCVPPRCGSGLGIYVSEKHHLKIVDGDRMVFSDRLGTDKLSEKGVKWALVECSNPKFISQNHKKIQKIFFVVLTLHTQPYDHLAADSSPHENWLTWFVRKIVQWEIQYYGGFPFSTVEMHIKQFREIRDYIHNTIMVRCRDYLNKEKIPLQRLVGFFSGGDFNVNRYAVKPGSKEEKDREKAFTEYESREFVAMCQSLNSQLPRVLIEPTVELRSKEEGKYTWDTVNNTLGRDDKAAEYAWLDSILYMKKYGFKTPKYMDNRVIAIRLAPFPEISPFYLSKCVRSRSYDLVKHGKDMNSKRAKSYIIANQAILQRLKIGQQQHYKILQSFQLKKNRIILDFNMQLEEKNDENLLQQIIEKEWINHVRSTPYKDSSQIWKGIEFYGFQISDKHAKEVNQNFKIGEPHSFKMLHDMSDHYAVMSRIILPTV